MRSLLSTALLALSLLTPALSSQNKSEADALGPGELRPTVFNGVEVPPLRELTGDTFEASVKDGYWYDQDPLPRRCHLISGTSGVRAHSWELNTDRHALGS
jgi:protein disulfide-isomerase